jgi:hypothetical protein
MSMVEINDKVFQMRVSEEFLQRIDGWRRDQPGIPSRAESIRRLVEMSLGPTAPPPRSDDIQALASQHVPAAVDALRQMANDPNESATARKKAAKVLARRGLSAEPGEDM